MPECSPETLESGTRSPTSIAGSVGQLFDMEHRHMTSTLRAEVDQAIDALIRGFEPGDPDGYRNWAGRLRRLEARVRADSTSQDLLERTWTAEASIAFDVEEYETVLSRTSSFREMFSPHVVNFLTIMALRCEALHMTGRHAEEEREILEVARDPRTHGESYILLMDRLVQRHPGALARAGAAREKLGAAIEEVRSEGWVIPDFATGDDPERIIAQIAEAWRAANRAKAAALFETGGERS